MKTLCLAMAAAATLMVPIRVVMALTAQPSEVCYDAYGNTRYVPVGEPCKSNETKTKILPQVNADPADDPQAQLQKQLTDLQAQFQQQVSDLTAKVSALQAQVNQSKNDQSPDYPESTGLHDAKTGKLIDDPRQLKPDDGDSSLPDNQVHTMPGQKGAPPKKTSDPKTPNNPSNATRITAPFQVVDSTGNVIVDVEANGTFRGLRAYAMNGSFAQLGNRDPSFYANVSVHAPHDEKPKVAIGIRADNGLPVVSIIGGDGKATAEMTQNAAGGEMHFYNLGGQLTTIIGTNSGNSEGHAVFADASQNPLLILGASGDHGDVILGDGKKSIAIWEMALTGFLR